MICERVLTSEIDSLAGKIIFHATKGSDITSTLMPTNMTKIGTRLGKVSRITGPNRIFYTSPDGSEGYVSSTGIGYFCDTEEEAQKLEYIRNSASEKIRSHAFSTFAEMSNQIKAISS